MKIINTRSHECLTRSNRILCAGFITGPMRAIGGAVQCLFNLIAVACLGPVGMIVATCQQDNAETPGETLLYSCISDSVDDGIAGIKEIFLGVFEFLPGSSFLSPHLCNATPIPNEVNS